MPLPNTATILERLRDELRAIRSGRATPALVEQTPVETYGSRLTLVELATITTPEPRLILIQPWDRNVLKDIERGLRASHPDLNPVVDGSRLRITLPPLTEERRREYLRLASEHAEQTRRALRGVRDARLRHVRDDERAGSLSEDAAIRERKNIEDAVKESLNEINELLKEKEAELLTL